MSKKLMSAALPILRRSEITLNGVTQNSRLRTQHLICGIDEAGRGPLAGPVYAAAVILGQNFRVRGLADSKILSEKTRDSLATKIKNRSLAWAVSSASVEEIDQLNILGASLLAMQRAIATLKVFPTEIWVDGLHCPTVDLPAYAIIQGDEFVPAISAASILAKTARDAEMKAWHQHYPEYGFDQHKGYPTPAHVAALKRHGASVIHRKSFAPVKEVLPATDSDPIGL